MSTDTTERIAGAGAVAVAARLERRRTGGRPRRHHPDGTPRRRPAASVGLCGRGRPGGASGGYRRWPGRTPSTLLFAEDEAVAVGVGLQRTAALAGERAEAAVRALAKLDAALPGPLRRWLRALRSVVSHTGIASGRRSARRAEPHCRRDSQSGAAAVRLLLRPHNWRPADAARRAYRLVAADHRIGTCRRSTSTVTTGGCSPRPRQAR